MVSWFFFCPPQLFFLGFFSGDFSSGHSLHVSVFQDSSPSPLPSLPNMLTPKYRIYNHGVSHNHTTHIYLSPALTFLTQLTGLFHGSPFPLNMPNTSHPSSPKLNALPPRPSSPGMLSLYTALGQCLSWELSHFPDSSLPHFLPVRPQRLLILLESSLIHWFHSCPVSVTSHWHVGFAHLSQFSTWLSETHF